MNYLQYQYTKAPNGDVDFHAYKYTGRISEQVDAIYTEALSARDKGLFSIEALPRPRSEEDLYLDANIDLPNFSREELQFLSKRDKISLLAELKHIRTLLPGQKVLESEFHHILLHAYRARKYSFDNRPLFPSDEETYPCIALGKPEEAPPSGLSLLGYAGSGKTSMIKTMVSHYPQVIWHDDDMGKFPQVVYLLCNCNASSSNDFASVLDDIARQVDYALGHLNGNCTKKMNKAKRLADKVNLVIELISTFNIGCIIIDEIQALDFTKNRKDTYSKLLQINNVTNVGFILVGTEQAYDSMFSDLHIFRRFPPLKASVYAKNIHFTKEFLKKLMRYQWFNQPIEVPSSGSHNEEFDHLVMAFHESTLGLVSLMVSLYEKVNFEYLIRKKKPEINARFVREVSKKYYSNIEEVIAKIDETSSYEAVTRKLQRSDELLTRKLQELDQKNELAELTNALEVEKKEKKKFLYDQIVTSVSLLHGEAYGLGAIQAAVKAVLNKKGALDKEARVLAAEALSKLQNTPKKKDTKSVSMNIKVMAEGVGDE